MGLESSAVPDHDASELTASLLRRLYLKQDAKYHYCGSHTKLGHLTTDHIFALTPLAGKAQEPSVNLPGL